MHFLQFHQIVNFHETIHLFSYQLLTTNVPGYQEKTSDKYILITWSAANDIGNQSSWKKQKIKQNLFYQFLVW